MCCHCPASMDEQGLYCTTAGMVFQDKETLLEHYRSDFHRCALAWNLVSARLLTPRTHTPAPTLRGLCSRGAQVQPETQGGRPAAREQGVV